MCCSNNFLKTIFKFPNYKIRSLISAFVSSVNFDMLFSRETNNIIHTLILEIKIQKMKSIDKNHKKQLNWIDLQKNSSNITWNSGFRNSAIGNKIRLLIISFTKHWFLNHRRIPLSYMQEYIQPPCV